MKRDIQRIMLAAAMPLFLIFILYILLKIVEVGMDWDFSRLGVYPMEKAGNDGYFDSSADTQRVQSFTGKYNCLYFSCHGVLFYFYRGIAGKYFYAHLARRRTTYLPDRKTGMAHRCQRIDLRTCLLSLFQWYSPQICSTHCHLFTCHLFIWRDYMAYVSLFLPHQYVVGRTS